MIDSQDLINLSQLELNIGLVEGLKILILSSIYGFLTRVVFIKYSRSLSSTIGFGNTLLLIMVSTASLIAIVKSSLALSLGLVGALSLYPTVTYVLWAIPLSKGELPNVTTDLVARLRLIINIELIGFSSIPFLATLMSRGVGLS